MNSHLQKILDVIQQNESVSEEDLDQIKSIIKKLDQEIVITEFKLDRTEKVKRTTAILLEETIEELEQKRKAVEESHDALKQTLEDLKSAQTQLIQSEKMASLGELTAGIAHEIQNPLNFVNNFSELNGELIVELLEELEEGNLEDVKEIASDISSNEEKIIHHGKRADGIVKGMLQHSRTTSDTKELVDINLLADEYLRLAYHGLKAKDKSFNADFKINTDESLPRIKVIPQDFGRVFLNLINNAFYTVSKKKKELNTSNTDNDFMPTVIISTINKKDKIEITVEDNGNGIPEEAVKKIFQPFFTTKPTGQGTGLGLSLSYDIVKAHGGKIKVDTKIGEGTKMTVTLPLDD
jgi:signal transduction histidine kinase